MAAWPLSCSSLGLRASRAQLNCVQAEEKVTYMSLMQLLQIAKGFLSPQSQSGFKPAKKFHQL